MKKRNIAFYRLVMIVALCVIVLGAFDRAQAIGDFEITLISKNVSSTATGNDKSQMYAVSGDGNRVVFYSRATDLITIANPNSVQHIYVYDHAMGTVTMVDKRADGTGPSLQGAVPVAFSQDGSRLLFNSSSWDLLPYPDLNGNADLFLYDVNTDTITLITKNLAGTGTANSASGYGSISANGNLVVFSSYASDLTANPKVNQTTNVYLYDVQADTITLISKALGSNTTANDQSDSPRISADGSVIVFESLATDLTADTDTNGKADVFAYNLTFGTMTLLSKKADGSASGNNWSRISDLSADGRRILIESDATDLTADTNHNGTGVGYVGSDLYLYNTSLQTDIPTLVSKNIQGTGTGNERAFDGYITADGRRIVYTSLASDLTLDPDTNGTSDVFLYDVQTGTNQLLSTNFAGTGAGDRASALNNDGNRTALDPDSTSISEDGHRILIFSLATDLTSSPETDDDADIYLYDVLANTLTLLVRNPYIGGTQTAESWAEVISEDGSTVVFNSLLNNLTAESDTNNTYDLFHLEFLPQLSEPTSLTAVPISRTQIDLSWTDNAADETSFIIQRSPNGVSEWKGIGTNAADDTTYSNTISGCNDTYFYRVRAHRSGDNVYSYYTNVAEANTWTCDWFADVPVAGKEWMKDWIEIFYNAQITTGCGFAPSNQPIYCPEASTTRAEMAVFIIRALHYGSLPYTPTDPDDHFDDVPVVGKEWMQAWIEEFYDLGITTGCAANPLRYCPERPVTRAEMAVFLLRALEGGSYQPPAASHYFSDVPVTDKAWMEAWIDEFYRRGITGGCAQNPLRFCPEREVTRAEMAVFIVRAFSIPGA